jgi:phosphoglycolate phosphatase
MIQYIVFDFDGTLADTIDVVKEIVSSEMNDINEEDFEFLRSEGIKQLIKRKKIPIYKIPKMVLHFASKLNTKHDIPLYPEMLPIIQKLSSVYRLGIVSSNSEEIIRQCLAKYQVEHLFDFVYSQSSIFGKHLVFKSMCKKHKLNPAEILYVGDEDRDIIACKKATIRSIAVCWGFNSEKRLREVNPDYLITTPKEIMDVLGIS